MIFPIDIEKLYWTTEWEADITDQGDFGRFYAHLDKVFNAGVKAVRKGKDIPELSVEYRNAFHSKMKRITMRTLLFEMELSADCGELAGETPEAQYRDFADNFLSNPEYLKELYAEYPLMYQDMLRYLETSVRNVCQVLVRFDADREELNRRFFEGNPCRRMGVLGGGDSDAHHGGQTVHLLELDNGERLVYKPRSMAVDAAYRAFLQWICERIGRTYWWNPVWDRGEYGWCGWVAEEPCHSYEELKRYYWRNGILLGIGYLLGSRDLHYENCIAHGEYPVIVDLEMGIGSQGGEEAFGKRTEVEQVFQESVLRTGILPTYAWDALGNGVNVGAVNGMGGQMAPFSVPVIVHPGTVRMHVEYRQPSTKQGKNLATLEGAFLQPWEFTEDIEGGFAEIYSFVMANQEQVLEKLELFQGVKVRYLVRHTQEYSMLITAMYHPDFLTGEEKRDALLRAGMAREENRAKGREWISMQEAEELKRGDIPYFWYEPDGLHLQSGTGEGLEHYFQLTAVDGIRNRMLRMSAKDLDRQKKFIRTALLMGDKSRENPVLKRGIPNVPDKERGFGDRQTGMLIADRIGELFLEEAIWADNGSDVGWISIVMTGYQERTYLIRPMGLYLYDGLAGVAIFMQRLGFQTGKKCYQDMAELLTRKLYTHTLRCHENRMTSHRPTGAFSGEASIAFAYMLMYERDRRQELLEYLYLQCEAVAESIGWDNNFDVLGGNAGAILVFLEAYEITKNRQYVIWAEEAGECLLKAAEVLPWGYGWKNPVMQIPLTGFAHGASGIMFALAKLGYYTGKEKYHQAAYQAFLFEEHYFDAVAQDWQDLRKPDGEKQQEYKMAWCHGWGGIVMARQMVGKYAEGALKAALQGTYAFIRKKVADMTDTLGDQYCLCHGHCGNAALLYGNGSEKGWELMNRILDGLSSAEDIRDCLGVQECVNFGLVSGMAGIGYSCLCGAEESAKILGMVITSVHTD